MIYSPPVPPKGELRSMHSFLLNKKQKVEMLNYKDHLLTKSLASLFRRRGTEGEAYEF